MNAFWKSFLKGFAGVLAAIAAALAFIFLGRRSSSSPTSIEEKADAEVEKKREEIKRDSDEELAARFNRLAKKEKKT